MRLFIALAGSFVFGITIGVLLDQASAAWVIPGEGWANPKTARYGDIGCK